jgi:glycerol-3-phosphate acyltransferase PlsY
MTTTWIIMMIAGYLLGSVPASMLVARARGIDLRRRGTFQVGAGNVWRTTSHRLGLAVGIFDFCKGAAMVLYAFWLGLDPTQQLVIGLAVVIGHNWPVFLRFHGGRGIATSGGIILVMPFVNDSAIWGVLAYLVILVGAMVVYRSSPVAILLGITIQPIVTAATGGAFSLTMAYLALLVIVIIKRLTAQASPESGKLGFWRLMVNRLIWDRDIADRSAWVSRQHEVKEEPV